MRFSRRLPPDLTASGLASHASKSRPRFDLTVSNPTQAGIGFPQPLGALFAEADLSHYAPDPLGLLPARAAIAHYLSSPTRTFSPENIVLTASTSEAYSLVFKTFCNPRDAVAVAVPSYPLIAHLLELEGLEVAHYELFYKNGWQFDLPSLERSLAAGVRAVVLVAPNNPTGTVPNDSTLASIARLCQRFDVPLIVDAVFAPYSSKPSTTARLPLDVLSLTLDGLSKAACLPQLKVGWTLVQGPSPLRTEALARLEFVNDAYLSLATPIQHILPKLLAQAPAVQNTVNARLSRNRAQLAKAFAQHARVQLLEDDGGWYAVLRLLQSVDEEAVVLQLITHNVLVQPGFLYDFAQGTHLVVSLLTPEADLAAGTQIMARVL